MMRGHVRRPRATAAVLASAAAVASAFVAFGAANAATFNTVASGLISEKINPAYDATRLATSASVANLLYVDQDVSFNGIDKNWESATWITLTPGQRRSASLRGVNTELHDDFVAQDRKIELRNLTLDHVDMDPDNVLIGFHPASGDSSFTLRDGSITAGFTPSLYLPAHFTLNAFGESGITGWEGRLSSVTTLMVHPGATLTIRDSGQVIPDSPVDRMYFTEFGNDGHVDGSTLVVQDSNVLFGPKPYTFSEPHSSIAVTSGATLHMKGFLSRIETDDLAVTDSAVVLDNNTRVDLRNKLTANHASVTAGSGGMISTVGCTVYGESSVTTALSPGDQDATVDTFALELRLASSLTIAGDGHVRVTGPATWEAGSGTRGQLRITESAAFVVRTYNGALRVRAADVLVTTRSSHDVAGAIYIVDQGNMELSALSLFTNDGVLDVDAGGALYVLGGVSVLGGSQGEIYVGEDSILAFSDTQPALSTLATNNLLDLDAFSSLWPALDPQATTNDRILLGGGNLSIHPLADLHLSVVNDQVLANGTKFVLIDYPAGQGKLSKSAHFNGYLDGQTFPLGLNTYQIRYYDPDYSPTNPTVVTLTVVPAVPPTASLSPAMQTASGTVGVALTPTAVLTPSGFGGMVTYTISPSPPVGLIFNNVTGVLSGWPASTQSTTTYTITGTGSVSGSATSVIALTVAAGSQAITFGPAPSPTFSPGGGFGVAATASSGLPVRFSSLTPAVCVSTVSGAVTMVGAGLCVIAANQAGNADYAAAPQVTQNVSISKGTPAPLILSASPTHIAGSDTSTLATSGGSGTGAITYAVTGPCSAVANTLTPSGAGTCTVVAMQAADANYNQAQSNPVAVTVDVAPQAPLVLTASPATLRVFGTSTLSATGGSGSGAVTYAVDSGPCSVAGRVVTANGEGQCQVSAAKAGDATHGGATSNPVTLTINRITPVPLLLTAAPTTVGSGGSSTLGTTGGIPGGAITYTISGPCFVTGDTLTGASAGTCVVTASQDATSIYRATISNRVEVTVSERHTSFAYRPRRAIPNKPFRLAPQISGFTSPTFALLYGTLPPGLTLDPATGVISGVPTGPVGVYDFVVSAYDDNAYDAALAVIDLGERHPVPALSAGGLLLALATLTLVFVRRMRRSA